MMEVMPSMVLEAVCVQLRLRDMSTCARVCKHWRDVAFSDAVWLSRFQRDLPPTVRDALQRDSRSRGWRELYRACLLNPNSLMHGSLGGHLQCWHDGVNGCVLDSYWGTVCHWSISPSTLAMFVHGDVKTLHPLNGITTIKPPHVKASVLFVGDPGVGKRSLLTGLEQFGQFPDATGRFDAPWKVFLLRSDTCVSLSVSVCDEPSKAPDVDAIVICFSLVDRQSFANVKNRWLPWYHENVKRAKKDSLYLVGTKSDLLEENQDIAVAFAEGNTLATQANLNPYRGYLETSAVSGTCLKQLYLNVAGVVPDQGWHLPEIQVVRVCYDDGNGHDHCQVQ
eukprot:TRINITY_DN8117_c0_g1_i1.p1 TRINITY_DN8117_c0_g1~~TRINITY_DN8117_c0_g1_i1.p1  ORF type:complete len:337 (-),score=63.36 TRINITY_DN8117_c0_g1_i1:70-1080(-)